MSLERRYPQTHKLGEGSITVNRLTAEDSGSLRQFAGEIPEHDKLFSHWDLALEEAVDHWKRSVRDGDLVAFSAADPDRWLGYAAVQRSLEPWSGHVAELRVMVAPKAQGRGIGRLLSQEAFSFAMSAGLEKLTARMTPDQAAAIRSFESLGFKPEALLKDHVEDSQGRRHDLLILANNLATSRAMDEAYGVEEALEE